METKRIVHSNDPIAIASSQDEKQAEDEKCQDNDIQCTMANLALPCFNGKQSDHITAHHIE
jgi:hypothetical protein